MTDLQKRSLLRVAALSAVASAAVLAGCGKKEEPAPAPALAYNPDGGIPPEDDFQIG